MADRTPRRERLKRAASRIREAVADADELGAKHVSIFLTVADANVALKSIRSDLCR